jgi:putative oxidoreductase
MNGCDIAKNYAPLAGRVLFALLFLQSGWHKIFDFSGYVLDMTGRGVPMPEVLLVLTIALVLAGGLMILFGWHARWAALALFVWMIPATLLYHAFWTFEPAQVFNQTNHFLKNLAIMGALLMITGMGTGPLSLDNCRCGARGDA